jgi:SWI/SNF-related matrix-associated actin-dependent regulator 1 of chromatin subfamily A
MDQCEDRLHRIGQKNSVYSINLVGSGTIDEHVMEVIDYKREIANQVTGGKNEASQMEQDLLINKLMNK